MNLRYIFITCDWNCSFTNEFVNVFAYNTRFICNWMSKNVRKLKIPTDGTFNLINVVVSTNEDSYRISSQETLRVTIHWTEKNIEEYLTLKDEGKRIQLYLHLLRKGLIRAADFYDIHLNELLTLIDLFQQNGCKNEWLLKSMYIKEWNIRLKFTCHFSTYDFKLFLTLYDKSKKQIAQKEVFQIYPDEIFFAKEIRKVVIEENKLFINDFLDKHFMSFDLHLLKDGIIEETILDEHIKKFMYEANAEEYKRIRWLQ